MTAQPAPLVYAVSAAPRLAGDFNGDHAVDILDLALWKQNAGKTGTGNYLQGDANGDLRVDGFDFVLWQRNLGATPPAAAASVVAAPESPADSLSAGPTPAEAADAALADLDFSRLGVAGLRV
ncbi:MAG TPA: dockerin type I domain-containing protein, partial [Lacipirellulaceae bacterium]|nr:dockerin type I domain-containing protein [Lacipirellulaceae bacterium]